MSSTTYPKGDVFIAYKREERALVDKVSAALRAKGHSVVTDADVPVTASFGDAIEAMIRAAKVVLVVWTAASAKSPWVKAEAQLGFRLGRLIGLRIGAVEPPFYLDTDQMIVAGDAALSLADLTRVTGAVGARLAMAAGTPNIAEEVAQASLEVQRRAVEQGAWQIASKDGSAAAYEKFLTLHPGGAYRAEAEAALARARTRAGKAAWVLGTPQLAGLAAVLALGVGLAQWAGSGWGADDLAETAQAAPVATVPAPEPPQPVQPEPVPEQTVVSEPKPEGAALQSETAGRVKTGGVNLQDLGATPDDEQWPLILTRDQKGALLGAHACAGGVQISGRCVPLDTTSLKLTSAKGIAALPMLQSLEAIEFENAAVSAMDTVAWQGLRYLPKLTSIDFSQSDFSDLSLVSGLRGIKYLMINLTDVSDLSTVSEMKLLEDLYAFESKISDLSPLANLPNLVKVDVSGNSEIFSIAALESAASLKFLDISNTKVSDVSALSNTDSLNFLYLNGTPGVNIAPLADLPYLFVLHLSNGTQLQGDDLKAFLAPLKSNP